MRGGVSKLCVCREDDTACNPLFLTLCPVSNPGQNASLSVERKRRQEGRGRCPVRYILFQATGHPPLSFPLGFPPFSPPSATATPHVMACSSSIRRYVEHELL